MPNENPTPSIEILGSARESAIMREVNRLLMAQGIRGLVSDVLYLVERFTSDTENHALSDAEFVDPVRLPIAEGIDFHYRNLIRQSPAYRRKVSQIGNWLTAARTSLEEECFRMLEGIRFEIGVLPDEGVNEFWARLKAQDMPTIERLAGTELRTMLSFYNQAIMRSELAPKAGARALIDLIQEMGIHDGSGSLSHWQNYKPSQVEESLLNLAQELEESVPEEMREAYRVEMEKRANAGEELDPEDFKAKISALMEKANR